MDTATTSPIERIARVLAGRALSRNGEGGLASAGNAVDGLWPDYADTALAVLKAMREPSASMAAAGDAAIWERMILTAIEDDTLSGS